MWFGNCFRTLGSRKRNTQAVLYNAYINNIDKVVVSTNLSEKLTLISVRGLPHFLCKYVLYHAKKIMFPYQPKSKPNIVEFSIQL